MKKNYAIGIDIGGTNLRIGSVTEDGEVLYSERHPVQKISVGPSETALEDTAACISEYIANSGLGDPVALGVAFPGTMDRNKTILYSASNLGENAKSRFDNLYIPAYLTEKLGFPCYLGKDTDFLLLNDMNKHQIHDSFLAMGIYFGTGVGSSICFKGDLFTGSDGIAGEIGHLPISESNIPCTCGGAGCVESVASGWRLLQIRDQHFPDVATEDIFTLLSDETPIRNYVFDCARVIALTGNLLNPEHTIVGGGIIDMKDFPRELLTEFVLEKLRHPYPRDSYKLLFSRAGKLAGVEGGAIYAYDQLKKQKGIL